MEFAKGLNVSIIITIFFIMNTIMLFWLYILYFQILEDLNVSLELDLCWIAETVIYYGIRTAYLYNPSKSLPKHGKTPRTYN